MIPRILAILQKEVKEIWRDPYTLGVALAMPLIFLVIFAYGLNTDVRNIEMVVLDFDQTSKGRDYTRAFFNSGYFRFVGQVQSYADVGDALDRDMADVAMVIPSGFDRDLDAGRIAQVQFLLDGSYTPFAEVAASYIDAVNAAFAGLILAEFVEARIGPAQTPAPAVVVIPRVRYNQSVKSVNSIVPGLFGVILFTFPPLLSTLAIVREKERGSIQQIFVSPTRPLELMVGKLIPYAAIAFLEMFTVLVAGVFWFGVPFRGNVALFLAASALYVFGGVGFGLLISTIARTQVVAMLLTLALTMMPSMLFSGFIFPIHTMPTPLQIYASLFPARYYIDLSRAIMLKGQGLETIGLDMGLIAAYGAGVLLLAATRFKKRIA